MLDGCGRIKIMKRLTLLLLITLILFSGCSSLSSWVKANLEGVPVWVYEVRVGRNQVSFVGKGSATTETRSKVLAYEAILKEVSSFIGEDVSANHLAQITKSKTVDQYNLKVTQEFVKKEDNLITTWFLAVADRSLLEISRTESERLYLQRLGEIGKLNNSASQYIRDNRDLLAIENYLDIILLADTLPLERGEKLYNDAVGQLKKVLQRLVLSYNSAKGEIPTLNVVLKRGTRSLAARVKEAPILTYYEAYDGLGKPYQGSNHFVTDNSGQFSFRNLNPTLVREGQLCFELDLIESFSKLQEIDLALYDELVQTVKDKRLCYSYKMESRVKDKALLVALREYSLQGSLYQSRYGATSIKSYLEKQQIKTSFAPIENLEEDEYLAKLRQQQSSFNYILFGDVGITQIKEEGGKAFVSVAGFLTLVESNSGNEVGSTSQVSSIGIGKTIEEATEKAFSTFGLISLSLINRFLYY